MVWGAFVKFSIEEVGEVLGGGPDGIGIVYGA